MNKKIWMTAAALMGVLITISAPELHAQCAPGSDGCYNMPNPKADSLQPSADSDKNAGNPLAGANDFQSMFTGDAKPMGLSNGANTPENAKTQENGRTVSVNAGDLNAFAEKENAGPTVAQQMQAMDSIVTGETGESGVESSGDSRYSNLAALTTAARGRNLHAPFDTPSNTAQAPVITNVSARTGSFGALEFDPDLDN